MKADDKKALDNFCEELEKIYGDGVVADSYFGAIYEERHRIKRNIDNDFDPFLMVYVANEVHDTLRERYKDLECSFKDLKVRDAEKLDRILELEQYDVRWLSKERERILKDLKSIENLLGL